MLAMTLLLGTGVIAARRLVVAAMAKDIEFPELEDTSTPSAMGPLLVSDKSGEIGDMVFLNDVRLQAEQGKSLNVVSIEALARGAGVSGERGPQRDLSDIARTWRRDPAFDSALAAQDTIDEGMWR